MVKKVKATLLLFFLILASMHAQDSLRTVIAKKGEGIYALLRNQGVNPYEYFDAFLALNKENIRDSVFLYEGKKYKIPAKLIKNNDVVVKKKGVAYPIFGKEHEMVVSKGNQLKGAVYYLISGHGGPDPGAITKYAGTTITEDEYAYDITLRLAKELLAQGATVYVIIRDKNDGIRDDRILKIDRDEVCYPKKKIPLNQLARLKQRVESVNQLYKKNRGKYQRLIVTHIDSRSKGQNIDVFFYHHEKSKNGKRLAESIHKTFQKKYRKYQPNRDYTGTFEDRSGLYMVRNTLPAMAYIEIGNIKNKRDQRRILDPENRQALAKWIGEGVLMDFKNK